MTHTLLKHISTSAIIVSDVVLMPYDSKEDGKDVALARLGAAVAEMEEEEAHMSVMEWLYLYV